MNDKFNNNAKVEQLTKMCLNREEEKGLIVEDPFVDSLHHPLWLQLVLALSDHDFFNF